MNKKIDLTDQDFKYFKVLHEIEKSRSGKRMWKCLCFCGKVFNRQQDNILYRKNFGCGCTKNITHGMSHTKTYKSWEMMIQRCTNSNFDNYEYYGGRGITVCGRWLESFDNFLEDMQERPEGKTLDRIDVNGNYCKNNCRWATRAVQAFNKNVIDSNTSGHKGVYFHKNSQKWIASIGVNGKQIYLGLFANIEDAIKSREIAENKYYKLQEADDMETMS